MVTPKLLHSRDNPLVKTLLKLSKSSHERRKQSMTLLDGPHLIESFDAAGHAIDAVVLSESGARRADLQELFGRVQASSRVVLSDRLFEEIATVNSPVGLMALVATPVAVGKPDPSDFTLMLEKIQDPGNLGSILRSAAAAGATQVLLSEDSVFAWSPKVLRAGMGAHFSLRIFEDCDLIAFAKNFRGQCVATDAQAQQSVFDVPLKPPVAWMFGNEGAGLSAELIRHAKTQVRIPMPGKTESLNIAAAAAICLFEQVRRAAK